MIEMKYFKGHIVYNLKLVQCIKIYLDYLVKNNFHKQHNPTVYDQGKLVYGWQKNKFGYFCFLGFHKPRFRKFNLKAEFDKKKIILY